MYRATWAQSTIGALEVMTVTYVVSIVITYVF